MHTHDCHRRNESLPAGFSGDLTVCVVDPNAADYQSWNDVAEAGGVRIKFFATAETALREGRKERVDLWVINADLPGISGCELCEMLKSRSGQAPVYLVADDYSAASEQAAWRARATMFGCKGSHSTWLGEWLAARQSKCLAVAH